MRTFHTFQSTPGRTKLRIQFLKTYFQWQQGSLQKEHHFRSNEQPKLVCQRNTKNKINRF